MKLIMPRRSGNSAGVYYNYLIASPYYIQCFDRPSHCSFLIAEFKAEEGADHGFHAGRAAAD